MGELVNSLGNGVKVYYTEYMPMLYMKVTCQGLTRSSLG